MLTAADLPAPALQGYAREVIRFAVSAWPLRAAEELRSALIYRALARAAAAVLPSPWPQRFRRVMHEELRHCRLCRLAGELLGAPPPTFDNTPVTRRLQTLPDDHIRTAALLTVEVAIGETVSMGLFRAGRRGATEPLTRFALEVILRDEVRHQLLGWDALDILWPMFPDSVREATFLEVARGLAAFEQQNAAPALRLLESGAPFDPACVSLGVLAPETRVSAFYDAVEQLVIPRLERLGMDGKRAWTERYKHFGEGALPGQDQSIVE